LGQEAPPLAHWLATARPKPGRVLIPGCGFGHDVRLFARHGFKAVGVDFSASAVAQARKLAQGAPGEIEFREMDLFELGRSEAASFDFAYEYTCIVAIDPARRPEYARLLASVLKPGGLLVGCFYNHGREGGPPFDITREQVLELFEPLFDVRVLTLSAHSVERRAGKELWAEFTRR
jgi:SAM-dependent methyltransferase